MLYSTSIINESNSTKFLILFSNIMLTFRLIIHVVFIQFLNILPFLCNLDIMQYCHGNTVCMGIAFVLSSRNKNVDLKINCVISVKPVIRQKR